MARTFSPLSTTIPLRTTWEEAWQMLQDDVGPPVDLTGYEARMFLLEVEDGDPVPGALPITYSSVGANPELTLTHIDGKIDLRVEATDVKALSPDNVQKVFAWEIELYVPAGAEPEYVIPLFKGFATVKNRVVLL